MELHIFARQGRLALGPQQLHRLKRLVEYGEPVRGGREVPTIRVIFLVVPAGTESKDEPPAGHHVNASRLLGQQPGIAVGGAGDELAQLRTGGHLRQRGHHRPSLKDVRRLPARNGLDVVVDPKMVVAESLGLLRDPDAARPRLDRVQPGVLELPALGNERPPFDRHGDVGSGLRSKEKYCTSTIMGSRYPT